MDTDHGNWTDICNIHTADVYLAAWPDEITER